jgi:hypothetical protein
MISFSWKVSKNFAIDLCFLYKFRNFTDGVSAVDLNLNWDRYKGDHKPSFEFQLVFINFMIFDFSFYNVNHEKFCPDSLTG